MQKDSVRTDLAAEAFKYVEKEINGIDCRTTEINGLKAELIHVRTSDAAQKLGKPVGSYFTLYLDDFITRRSVSFSDAAFALAELLRKLPAIASSKSFLVACLGNRAVTPDALGPYASDGIIVTRHLKASLPASFAAFSEVSVVRPGVLGTTGMESADAVKALCASVRPDCVIAVDALAAGDPTRLCRNVQLCDTGISPGAGVGNDRAALNEAFLGVPVIALGVPTVIDLAAFTDAPEAKSMFVTPRNIDELVKSTAKLISYGINLALHDGLTVGDVDVLTQ